MSARRFAPLREWLTSDQPIQVPRWARYLVVVLVIAVLLLGLVLTGSVPDEDWRFWTRILHRSKAIGEVLTPLLLLFGLYVA